MLVQDIKLLMVSENDFYKEIETSDDIKLSNLKNPVYDKSQKADIVIFQSNHSTVVMRNRYGGIGQVV